MQPVLTANEPANSNEKITPRRRRRLPISFLIGGVAIVAAVIYLIFANTQSNAVYYMTVAELHNCTTCAAQPSVRVAGVVQAGSIVRNDPAQKITFVITANGQSMQVIYSGVVPDIFRPGIQVVVEGHYTGTGPFHAQTLLAKCPSKFQAATPGTSQ